MSPKFQLLHHIKHGKFSLVKECEDWRHEFNNLDDATRYAAQFVSGRIPLLEIDENGSVVAEKSIETSSPRS
jgi:hypothetical protein